MGSGNYATETKITVSGDTGITGGNETRPENYTIRIWKRTA